MIEEVSRHAVGNNAAQSAAHFEARLAILNREQQHRAVVFRLLAHAPRVENIVRDVFDGLTGLVNAREFRRRLDAAFARPDRRAVPLSLLLIDYDHFKSVNDQLGHQHGDLVLQMGARIVRATVRGQDVVARYGGDELAVIVADANGAAAQRLAYRIVDAVHAAEPPQCAITKEITANASEPAAPNAT